MIRKTLSHFYGLLVDANDFLYRRRILDSMRSQGKVISVGNLSMGGAGKTPIVDLILKHAVQKNKNIALISKSYKAMASGVHKIDLKMPKGASFYGDEPWMLAQLHPQVKVFVGPQKYQSLNFAEKTENLDCYVIDDGFQHRALQRDLDIVIVDVSAPLSEIELIPQGRAREGLQSLSRAHIVILSKVNHAQADLAQRWRDLIASHFQGLVVEANYLMDMPDLTDKRVLVVCGIAKPTILQAEVASRSASVEMAIFPDHHQYSAKEVQEICNKSKSFDLVLTTAKDYVKLSQVTSIENLKVIGLKVEFIKGGTEFYGKLDQLWG